MGATTSLPNTHDVGTRTSWNLRPEVAFLTPDWQQKRAEMKQICAHCHASDWVENFYFQYDALVNMSNDKFFIPARDVMKKLAAAGKITNIPFDSQIKWTYYELWHHQGRRARMGACMKWPRSFTANFCPKPSSLCRVSPRRSKIPQPMPG
jgi:hypothetical protein